MALQVPSAVGARLQWAGGCPALGLGRLWVCYLPSDTDTELWDDGTVEGTKGGAGERGGSLGISELLALAVRVGRC